MPVITTQANKVTIRLYAVGLDKIDAFGLDKELFPTQVEAKKKALAIGQRVFTTVQHIAYGDIREA